MGNNRQSETVNGAIHVECKTLRHVVTSAADAETEGIFYNAQNSIRLRHILNSMGHLQPPTPIKTEFATANGHSKTLKM